MGDRPVVLDKENTVIVSIKEEYLTIILIIPFLTSL